MSGHNYNQDFALPVYYQITQTYIDRNSGHDGFKFGDKIIFPRIFNSRKACRAMIEQVMKLPLSKSWDFIIEERYGSLSSLSHHAETDKLATVEMNTGAAFERCKVISEW